MPYPFTDWKDHVVEYPKRITLTDNGDGTYTIEPSPGEIIQQGTPMSATNFNNLEDGILDVNTAAKLMLNGLRQDEDRISDLETATIQETGTVTLTVLWELATDSGVMVLPSESSRTKSEVMGPMVAFTLARSI